MTGFGSHSFEVAGVSYSLELKSVNGRHGDVRVRLPWPAPLLEGRLCAEARAAFHRGRLDVLLRTGSGEREPEADVAASPAASSEGLGERLRAAHRGLRAIAADLDLPGRLEVRDLIAYAELVDREDPGRRGPPRGLSEAASAALALALADWNQMRAREGAAMERAVGTLLAAVERAVETLEGLASEQQLRLAERLRGRVETLLGELGVARDAVDASRLTGEIALTVDRADVTEELTRLRSHLEQFRASLVGDGPRGRKLDFLLQELHREVNTTGAKVQDARMSALVVELKADLEKIREIIQNIE